jgi:hypothetical protein
MRRALYNSNYRNCINPNYYPILRSSAKNRRVYRGYNFTRKNIPYRSGIYIYPDTSQSLIQSPSQTQIQSPNQTQIQSQTKTITIPTTATSINENDYNGDGVIDVIFTPTSLVTTINTNAFANFTSLKSVTIPSSVTTIAVNAFLNCSNLKTVRIQSTKISIDNKAFIGCHPLLEVCIVIKPKTS